MADMYKSIRKELKQNRPPYNELVKKAREPIKEVTDHLTKITLDNAFYKNLVEKELMNDFFKEMQKIKPVLVSNPLFSSDTGNQILKISIDAGKWENNPGIALFVDFQTQYPERTEINKATAVLIRQMVSFDKDKIVLSSQKSLIEELNGAISHIGDKNTWIMILPPTGTGYLDFKEITLIRADHLFRCRDQLGEDIANSIPRDLYENSIGMNEFLLKFVIGAISGDPAGGKERLKDYLNNLEKPFAICNIDVTNIETDLLS